MVSSELKTWIIVANDKELHVAGTIAAPRLRQTTSMVYMISTARPLPQPRLQMRSMQQGPEN